MNTNRLPDYYEFQHAAKVLSGSFALENIPAELKNLGAEKPLLLSDKVLEKIGTLQIVVDALLAGNVEISGIYTDIPADSSVEIVNEIAEKYRTLGCDSIVAVGGGSVIDTAKGVRMLLSTGEKDMIALMGCENIPRGMRVPFVAVPTTSGTGSESTLVAVIKNEARKLKMEFISYYLQPDAAVLDVRMTQTLPPRMTASTGMDALCHAIEASSCLQKNPLSDAYAAAAITMIRDYLKQAVTDGKNKEARLALSNASMMAGAAFSNSMVGIIHAIGHALGGVCHVPHGDAMTILLPHGMNYNKEKADGVYGELLLHLAGAEVYASTAPENRGQKAIDTVREMGRELHEICGLPTRLQDVGVKREDFEAVAKTAMNDGAMIVNPRQAGKEDIIRILEAAY